MVFCFSILPKPSDLMSDTEKPAAIGTAFQLTAMESQVRERTDRIGAARTVEKEQNYAFGFSAVQFEKAKFEMNIQKRQSLTLSDKGSNNKTRKNKLMQDQQNKFGK